MDYQSVTDLPGIGSAYGGRLNRAGYRTARDVYNKFESLNFDSNRCQGWLNSVCDANSRYSSMCYESLRDSREQFGGSSYSPRQERNQSYHETVHPTNSRRWQPENPPQPQVNRAESPKFSFLPKPYKQQSPERALHTPVQQTPARSGGSDISKAEVMQMMAEFREKQDAMATKISNLEQEKFATDRYVKTLESKIELMDKKTAELHKRQDAKIAEHTEKMRAMDRTERYKNISNSIYLLSQKFEDMLTELNEAKHKTTNHSYVKTLQVRLDYLAKLQKQQDAKFSTLSNQIVTTNTHIDRYKEVSSSINLLAQKFDELIMQQREAKQDKTTIPKSLDVKIKQMEQDLRNLTVEISNLTKTSTEAKQELLNTDKQPTEKPNARQTRSSSEKNSPLLKDKIVEQVKLSSNEDDISKMSSNINA